MRVFSFVFILFGFFLGAGFVSGKEIASYFSVFGKYSILGIITVGVLLFFLLMFFINLTRKVGSFREFVSVYFGKYSGIIEFLFSFAMIIFIGAMVSGNYIIADYFKINKVLLLVITLLIVYLLVIGKSNSISKVNTIIMPIVVVVLLYVTITDKMAILRDNSMFKSFVFGANYGLINIVPMGVFLLDLGKGKELTKKEIIAISFLVAITVSILLFVYNNAIILNGLEYSSMPILVLVKEGNWFIKLLTGMSIYIGMLTTLVSCVFVLTNYINSFIKGYKRSTMLSLVIGLITSFFGFDIIVNYIYTFIGIIGLIVVVVVIKKEGLRIFNPPKN